MTRPTTRYAHNALGQRVFKTEALYPSAAIAAGSTALTAFFAKGWAPTATNRERVGFAYVYDGQGTLIGQYGAGGAKSTGSRQYVWLSTPAGPMPVATIQNGTTVQSVTADHLNIPRRVAGADGTLLWQWSYSAFGEEQPTVAERRFASGVTQDGDLEFNLRYPGQYFDKESKLHYNGFRTYDPATGRYTQADPIGLNGGRIGLGMWVAIRSDIQIRQVCLFHLPLLVFALEVDAKRLARHWRPEQPGGQVTTLTSSRPPMRTIPMGLKHQGNQVQPKGFVSLKAGMIG